MQSVMAALRSLAAAAHHRSRAFKLRSLVSVQTSRAQPLVAQGRPHLQCFRWPVVRGVAVQAVPWGLVAVAGRLVAHRRGRTFKLLPPLPLLPLLLLMPLLLHRVTHLALHLHTVRAP